MHMHKFYGHSQLQLSHYNVYQRVVETYFTQRKKKLVLWNRMAYNSTNSVEW